MFVYKNKHLSTVFSFSVSRGVSRKECAHLLETQACKKSEDKTLTQTIEALASRGETADGASGAERVFSTPLRRQFFFSA